MLALGTFLLALALSYLGTRLMLRGRFDRWFVDVPNARSSHETPKPRFGGIAIVAAFVVVYAALLAAKTGVGEFAPLVVGGAIVFAVGVVDDRRSLSVFWRFAAQGVAIAIVVGTGHVVDHIYIPMVGTLSLGPAAVPFTVLFIATGINFYNFIDGIDGLAAGSAFIVAGFVAAIAGMLGHAPLTLLCLAIAGGTLGFLQFNLPPSRLFMGDSGSTFLGFFFACIAVIGNGLEPQLPFFIPVLILSSLYLDAGLTLVRRAIRGERIFKPHHTHYYQRLLSLGMNHKQVTFLEYGVTVLLGVSALVFVKAGGLFPIFLTVCWVVIFAGLILKIQGLERGDRHFWERRSLLVVAGDLVMIAAAYFGAYFIRMNFQFTDPEGTAVLRAFPIVLVVRSATFYWYGLYRGVWKYTSTPDVVRIIKAVTMGSLVILALMVLFYRFVAFPRSMFVIEYFLLIVVLGGSRFASRLFHEFGKEAHGAHVKRVAILGAGDYAERLSREIRNAGGKSTAIACYVDDNAEKIGLVLQGIPIEGPIHRLADICRKHDVSAVAIGISNLEDERLKLVLRQAAAAGVEVRTTARGDEDGEQRGLVDLERIRIRLGRSLPAEPTEISAGYYRTKRVLMTHGGETIGRGLAQELVRLGARVTVHVDGQREAERFHDIDPAECRVFVGSIERELDAARMLDVARPDVVFHCTSMCAPPIVNRDDYLWRQLVRTTDALRVTLAKHAVESLVFLNLWGNEAEEGLAGHLGAAGEVIALNSPELLPAVPKVVRLPGVLSRRRAARYASLELPADDRRFVLLETEAIALALDVGAHYKGRVIVVPRVDASMTGDEIAGIVGGAQGQSVRADGSVTMLYPNEIMKPSILAGAREVVSPSYPASETMLADAIGCAQKFHANLTSEHFAALHAALFETARKVRSSAE